MAFSGQLGSSLASLGATFALGFLEEEDPTNQNASNAFGFSSVATYDPVYNVFVSQTLLSQDLTSNYHPASNTIFGNPSEDNKAGFNQTVEVTQYLGFTDRFFTDPIGNTLGLDRGQKVAEAVVDSVANYVFTNPTEDNKVIQAYIAANTIGFTLTTSLSVPLNVDQQFNFVQTVTHTGSGTRNPSNTGFLKQNVGFTISDNACREKQYDPLIGEGAEDFEELAVNVPTLGTGTLTLTYPRVSPTTTLVLENPEFGNDDTVFFTRIDRDTRGGSRILFSDPKWASWERLTMTVVDLCERTADEIIAFLNASLGQKIGLQDWEGRTWEGVIIAPETDVRKQVSGWQFTLTFEGVLTESAVQQGGLIVIQGQDSNGNDIEVIQGL